MYYLIVFKHFITIFSVVFDQVDSFFSLILDLLDPAFLQNFRSDWVQLFLLHAEPWYRKFCEVPTPLLGVIFLEGEWGWDISVQIGGYVM